MNDPFYAIQQIEKILLAARDQDRNGQLTAYSATRLLVNDLEAELDSRLPDGSGYLHEKLVGLAWHIGAMFGLDTDNGHGPHAHLVWALSNLSVLRSNFERLIAAGYPMSQSEVSSDHA